MQAGQLNSRDFSQTASESAAADSPSTADALPKPDAAPSPLRSVHTTSFAEIVNHLGVSVAVTTYQAGKLVLLRAELPLGEKGKPVLNTHFRGFNKPMGFAYEPGRFALGTNTEIWEFHDMPAVAAKLDTADSPARHDAAFLPRTSHITGDVQVHEMVWVPSSKQDAAGNAKVSKLWFVNTRFSCLATRSEMYNFVPRWKPPFITALAPTDRCHLNGLALRDGKIRYVTALGETDTPAGWRDNKRSGGVLIDVASNQIITRGLSMPHSPRWHNGRLWVLNSGSGGVGVVDTRTGKYQEICRLPGFTRGLDFAGPYAFIGLSQVRESAVFSGIAIAEMKQQDRSCGVWIIDTRSGETVGFVKFVEGVQEIFAVQLLRGLRWPEVLSEDTKRIAESYELPDKALRLVPEKLREPSKHAIKTGENKERGLAKKQGRES
jgi:uncharacterized protein (TIGR03032 family)